MHIHHYGRAILLFLLFWSYIVTTNVHANDYPGFLSLNSNKCSSLDKDAVLKLPTEWHKYGDFAKICGLKAKKTKTAKIFIVSIWVLDYYKDKSPEALWEKFPLPIIVKKDFKQIGQLPRIYPMDHVVESFVYYGKWKSGFPHEIRVDVFNPTLTGNYYFRPLIWNNRVGSYEMKSEEPIYGKRTK